MNTQIKGSLAVCCDMFTAGHQHTAGNAEVKGNMKVGGWLDAPNLKTPCKGLFPSPETLMKAYPMPRNGWWALVGSRIPAEVYIAVYGKWTDSGTTGGDTVVDLNAYDEALGSLHSEITAVKSAVDSIEHPIDVKDTDIADLILADEKENVIAMFADGHIRTANFDSASMSAGNGSVASPSVAIHGKWLAIGTSVTYWDKERKGYQSWIREWMEVDSCENKGVWGGTIRGLADVLDTIEAADVYTIEHGINDWRLSTPLGSISDFIGDTGSQTFYGAYRKVIDRIYRLNKQAAIVLMTPVKACGGYGLPEHTYDGIGGVYLEDFAVAIKEIAGVCSLPVADVFARSGLNQWNLDIYSADYAIHPNEQGHKRIASVLYHTLSTIKYLSF